MRLFAYILILILAIIASLEAGWIIRDRQKDDIEQRIQTLYDRQYYLSGRVTVLEGPIEKRK